MQADAHSPAWQATVPHSVIGVRLAASRTTGMRLGPWMDIAAVAIPLGQAIGRVANYINQELYGGPTNLPWGINIPREARVSPYESLIEHPIDTLFHPLWAYEALWSLVAFVVLWRVYHLYRGRLVERRHPAPIYRAVFHWTLPAGIHARGNRYHWANRHQQLADDYFDRSGRVGCIAAAAAPRRSL